MEPIKPVIPDDSNSSQLSGNQTLVIHDFVATNSDELNIKEGEVLEIVEVDSDGWTKVCL